MNTVNEGKPKKSSVTLAKDIEMFRIFEAESTANTNGKLAHEVYGSYWMRVYNKHGSKVIVNLGRGQIEWMLDEGKFWASSDTEFYDVKYYDNIKVIED